MATVHLALARTSGRADTGSTLPIPDPVPVSETITSTTSNQVSATVSGTGTISNGAWSITVTGGNVWVAFGATPDASVATARWLILAGETRAFAAQSGHKVAVLNA